MFSCIDRLYIKEHNASGHTLGTRGDVQPYIAFASGLIRRGHEVQIAAPVQFESMIREHAIPCWPLPGDFLELMNTPEGKAAIADGHGFSAGLKLLKHVRPLMRRLLDEEWDPPRELAAFLDAGEYANLIRMMQLRPSIKEFHQTRRRSADWD